MRKSLIFSLVMLAQAAGYSSSNHASAMTLGPIVAPAASDGIVMVLCKYGTPHCVNPDPGPKAPKVNTNTLPDDGWVDPDCAVLFGSVRLPE